MRTLIVHPGNKEQMAALKAFMKALKISFEEDKSPYNPEFVKTIQQGDEDLKAGKGIRVDIDNLFIGKVETGLKDIEEGRIIGYQEVKQKFFDKWGR